MDELVYRWKDGEEELMHTCLVEAYEVLGYVCNIYHKSGRTDERGIDILCEKEDNRIGIAAKIKPKKNDSDQLQKFADQEELGKKVYVYGQDPTPEFSRAMKKHRDTIEFLGPDAISSFLLENKSQTYQYLLFLQSPLVVDAEEIILSLEKHIGAKPEKPDFKKILLKESELFFQLKDDLVKSNSLSEFIKEILIKRFTEKTFDQTNYRDELRELLLYLSYVHTRATSKLKIKVEEWAELYPSNACYFRDKISKRSGFTPIYQRMDRKSRPLSIILYQNNVSYIHSINSYLKQISEFYNNLEWGFDTYLFADNE
ncbi:MAG: hypothetical protein V1827_06725 [Candidatus Micrarchaeota archaeon]